MGQMLDFIKIQQIETKKSITIFPEFVVKCSSDLMIKGKSFYAIWDEAAGLWCTSEMDVQRLVDQMVFEYADKNGLMGVAKLKLLRDFSTNKWSEWQKYCKSLSDNYHELDENVLFRNSEIGKKDYATRSLDYALIKSPTPAYDKLMDTLYAKDERRKLEWAIGSIIAGDSKKIQKFFVLYGAPGTGKSTVLNIIDRLFSGYCSVFDAKSVGENGNAFALDAFRNNPLIAIQHDGDLSRIEDNTKINSIVSHETMMVNEKFKSPYPLKFKSMLFIGTNKPVRITDAKSGILRRLIDVSPTGIRVPPKEYDKLMEQIGFELGGIAAHCLEVYKEYGKKYYNDYVPMGMMEITNDFYIFMEDNYDLFAYAEGDCISLNTSWIRYKDYCDKANVKYPMTMRAFKVELAEYYKEFHQRFNGQYSVYVGFKKEKIASVNSEIQKTSEEEFWENDWWLQFKVCERSEFDQIFSDAPAQYAAKKETPTKKWADVVCRLKDIDPTKLHYVKVPENHIVIDFDLKDEDGNKSFKRNVEAASKWPQTYAELSKSGGGIHLHYWFDGDVSTLSRIVDEHIEIKIFTGNSSLRRKLTKCNDIPFAHISAGLPLKERSRKMVSEKIIKDERMLRSMIEKNLRKEVHPNTKPSMDFIHKLLEDAYESGIPYDVRDMRPAIQIFALNASNQSDYCLRLMSKMKFMSEEQEVDGVDESSDVPIVFFDVEVFPNLFVVCHKMQGTGNPVCKMINPTPDEVSKLTRYRLVGFNNRKYDNHILYARIMGYTNKKLYELSQRIIINDKEAFFGEAYNLSYTDIYDFMSAQNKMSLKKWEIKLGIHHQELGIPWDEPVDEVLWEKVADYCANDVVATEAVWDANQSDKLAREILADLAGMPVNSTTNQLTTKIIVGNDGNPQEKFVYTDLSTIFPGYRYDKFGIPKEEYNEDAKIVTGKSIYRGEDPGEGGCVYSEPGIYTNVALLDIVSMHPTSAIELNIFGDEYTNRFKSLKDARVLIKHKEFEKAGEILDGMLKPYLKDAAKAAGLPNALKTAINSVYGLTSAKFPNKLKDPKNVDNIVAKRGALFMIDLKHAVQDMGYTVIHIKTDSIKIADADDRIIQFVKDYGKKFGYDFEFEAFYDRICLVNDAVYIAKVSGGADGIPLEEPYWTATGTQFQIPYVFKTLFSKENITPQDLIETKSVSTALYLDMNEGLEDGEHKYHFVGKVGAFYPMKDGAGGGLLLREIAKERQKDKRFASATGSSGKNGRLYRWMEVEMVNELGLIDKIDMTYYRAMADEAIETISEYGDFERFVSEEPYQNVSWMDVPEVDEDIPFL